MLPLTDCSFTRCGKAEDSGWKVRFGCPFLLMLCYALSVDSRGGARLATGRTPHTDIRRLHEDHRVVPNKHRRIWDERPELLT